MTEQTPEESQGHPAWQDILNELPDDLHPLIKPKLEDWDRRVQDKLQEVRTPYEPYQPLVENNISPEEVQQALYLRHLMETNPNEVVQRAIESFGLEYVPKSQVPSNTNDPDDEDDDFFGNNSQNPSGTGEQYDITKHPAFQQMMEKVNQAEQILTSRQQAEQEQAQQEELEEYLESLHQDENGNRVEFDDLYVATLIANGVDGEEAVNMYNQTVTQAVQRIMAANNPGQQTPNIPVVMGGDGSTGSGVPNNPVKMGELSKGGVTDLVMQFLEQNKSQS